MKYIVYKLKDEEHAIVFPKHLVHKRIAQGLRTMDGIDLCVMVGAGFVFINNQNLVTVTGRSESLNLRARPADVAIIERSILHE